MNDIGTNVGAADGMNICIGVSVGSIVGVVVESLSGLVVGVEVGEDDGNLFVSLVLLIGLVRDVSVSISRSSLLSVLIVSADVGFDSFLLLNLIDPKGYLAS